jgi:hypothetical protein
VSELGATAKRYVRIGDVAEDLQALHRLGFTFLVPSRADQGILMDLLLGEASALRDRPRIVRWDGLYQMLLREAHRSRVEHHLPTRRIDPSDRYVIARWALSRSRTDGSPPMAFDPKFPHMAASQMVELLREEVTGEHLLLAMGCGECGACPADSAEALLCATYRHFTGYLEANRLMDEAQLPTMTSRLLHLMGSLDLRLALVGFLSFTHGQLNLVRLLRDLGCELCLLIPWVNLEGVPDCALQMGIDAAMAPHSPPPSCQALLGLDPHHQYEALARELALLGSPHCRLDFSGPLDQVAISVPEEDLRRVRWELTRHDVPFWIQGGTSLSESLAFRVLMLALNAARSRWAFRPTLRLLSALHPRQVRSEVISTRPRGRDQWLEALKGPLRETFESISRRADRFLEPPGLTPGEAMDQAQGIMEAVDLFQLARGLQDRPHMDWTIRTMGSALEEAQKRRFALSRGQDLGEAFRERLDGQEAIQFLAAWGASSYTAQEQPLQGAVRVYRGNPPVLADHRCLILCGADQSRWPGKLRESATLGEESRRRLNRTDWASQGLNPTHLVEIHERRAEKEALFLRLALTARDLLVLSRPVNDREGRPTLKSPFEGSLHRVGIREPVPMNPTPSLLDGPPIRGIHLEDPWDPPRRTSPLELLADRVQLPAKVRLSQLDTFSQCPFAFACEAILELKIQDRDPASSVSLSTLAHHGLRLLGEALSKGATPVVERCLLEAMEGSGVDLNAPRFMRQRALLSDLLDRCLQWLYARREALKDRLIDTLWEVELPPIRRTNLVTSGRADMVDLIRLEGQQVGAFIVDFKWGNSDGYSHSLQPGAYSLAIQESHVLGDRGDVQVLGCGIVSFREMLNQRRFRRKEVGRGSHGGRKDILENCYWLIPNGAKAEVDGEKGRLGDLDLALKLAGRALDELDSALGEGVFAAGYGSKRCDRCQYQGLCRRLEEGRWLSREDLSEEETDERD